jgi:hypothetical protein
MFFPIRAVLGQHDGGDLAHQADPDGLDPAFQVGHDYHRKALIWQRMEGIMLTPRW